MLKINKNNITLTRGDTAEIEINLEGHDLKGDDILILTVKTSTSEESKLIQSTALGRVFKIKPTDTKNLDYGDYVYDVQLTTASGDVYTVITPSKFTIAEEVTW